MEHGHDGVLCERGGEEEGEERRGREGEGEKHNVVTYT